MTKQLPPRHPTTGQFVKREQTGKVNKASTNPRKPAQVTSKGKASAKEGK